MPFFGFIPSQELLDTIHTAHQNKNGTEPLYPLRDKIALMINDEIIDAILTELLHRFPASEKRETAEKLAGYIKSTVAVLLKQLLGKSSNDVVKQSIEFSEHSLLKDGQGQFRIGEPLSTELVQGLKNNYAEILSGIDVGSLWISSLLKRS